MLTHALGQSYKYCSNKKCARNQYGTLTEEWKYYSASSGWTLESLLKADLFFFAPCEKDFRIAFIFGDKAVSAGEESNLPAQMVQELKSAKRYVEGRGLRLEIKRKGDVKHVIALAGIKIHD